MRKLKDENEKKESNNESIYNILKSLLAITKSFHRRLTKLEKKIE